MQSALTGWIVYTFKIGIHASRAGRSFLVARVTYHVVGDEKNIRGASLPAPKRASEIFHWFKAARIALPQIPNPEDGHWFVSHVVATVHAIIFELHSDGKETGLIVIDRKAPTIGM